jgi:hypothetical protein
MKGYVICKCQRKKEVSSFLGLNLQISTSTRVNDKIRNFSTLVQIKLHGKEIGKWIEIVDLFVVIVLPSFLGLPYLPYVPFVSTNKKVL